MEEKLKTDTVAGEEMHRGDNHGQLVSFVLANDTVRGAFLHGTSLVASMRESHGYGLMETLVMGHGLLAAALMSSGLKGRDRISIDVECSGPIKGLVAEANAWGQVRGYLKNVPIPIDKPLDSFDLRPFFGAGFLTVKKHLEGGRHPYQGRVMMSYGSLAQDLAHYYLTSEQIPTALQLSVSFDRQAAVEGAGGMLIQALPEAGNATITRLEKVVAEMPSLGKLVAGGKNHRQIIDGAFQDLGPRILSWRPVWFGCHCNQQRVKVMLTMLGADELKDMAANGPFPVQVRCHYCNRVFSFSRQELQSVLRGHFSEN